MSAEKLQVFSVTMNFHRVSENKIDQFIGWDIPYVAVAEFISEVYVFFYIVSLL
jgi:hypothetical protein